MKGERVKRAGNAADRVLSRLAAEKKKTICASCLIAVMVFMWARVLTGRAPQSAEAALMARKAADVQSNSGPLLKISFIELPKVKGRNDVLTRDFFASCRWQDFTGGGARGVNVVSGNGSEEVARQVAEKLKLEAIGLGENAQAFINDKLLSVGDKLLILDGGDTYECEVTGIEETKVFIRCGRIEITLKLAQEIENSG